jgi:hypothetical protein
MERRERQTSQSIRLLGGRLTVALLLVLAGLASLVLAVPAAAQASITLSPPSQTANVGSTVTLTVSGATPGAQVSFAISGPNSSYKILLTTDHIKTADQNGYATFQYQGLYPGTDTVTATLLSDGNPTATATVTWVTSGAPVSQPTLTLTPATQTVAPSTTVQLLATLTQNGQPITDAAIRFTVSGANPQGPITLSTNGNGQAIFTYTPVNLGTDTVTASSIYGSASATVVVSSTTTGVSVTLSPTVVNATVGTSVSLTATVLSNGSPVSGAAVTFTVSGANSQSGSATTDANGHAVFTYTGTNAGTDTVTATYNSVNAYATVNWSTPTQGLSLSPTSQTQVIGGTASVTATFYLNGSPISGVPVYFSVSGANPLGAVLLYTNSAGQATFTYSGANAGTDTVTATATYNNTTYTASATVTWSSTAVSSISLSPTTLTVATGTSVTLVATVLGPNSQALVGVPVTFTVSGANPQSTTVYTNSAGQASFTYTPTNAGTDTVTASYSGASATATITVTSGVSLTLAPSSTTPTVNNAVQVTATLTSNGAPLSGITVTFTVTGANPQSGSATTDANGHAVFTYTGANTGTDTVTATAQTAGNPTATATITWQATPSTPVFGPAQPAQPSSNPACIYFPQTQHNLCYGFRAYWEQFGGLAIFGYPLTEEFQENGLTVQYFERARFEWHPGQFPQRYDVLLGLLGDEVTAGRQGQAPFQPAQPNNAPGCVYFAQTGHNVCGDFLAFWQQNGGLATFGYPISEPFAEQNPDTGQVYTAQYFERQRFEAHPEANVPYHVLLGRLGAQVLHNRYGTPYP